MQRILTFFIALCGRLVRFCVQPKKLIPYGFLEKRALLKVLENEYVLEQYLFKDSIDSYRYYRKVVTDYAQADSLQETKYDLYDWSFTYFRYDRFTFRVVRFGNRLQCVRSVYPLSIPQFELDASGILKAFSAG